jgi:hypothetical protein
MPIDPIDARKVAVAVALGGIAGAAVIQSHHDQKRKSKPRRITPKALKGSVNWCGVFLTIGSPQTTSERTITPMTWSNSFAMNWVASEAMMVDELVWPNVRKPFVGSRIFSSTTAWFLELKVDPAETEKDRLVGQCCKYSQEWVTWAIVIDMPDERVEKLVALQTPRVWIISRWSPSTRKKRSMTIKKTTRKSSPLVSEQTKTSPLANSRSIAR